MNATQQTHRLEELFGLLEKQDTRDPNIAIIRANFFSQVSRIMAEYEGSPQDFDKYMERLYKEEKR